MYVGVCYVREDKLIGAQSLGGKAEAKGGDSNIIIMLAYVCWVNKQRPNLTNNFRGKTFPLEREPQQDMLQLYCVIFSLNQ